MPPAYRGCLILLDQISDNNQASASECRNLTTTLSLCGIIYGNIGMDLRTVCGDTSFGPGVKSADCRGGFDFTGEAAGRCYVGWTGS